MTFPSNLWTRTAMPAEPFPDLTDRDVRQRELVPPERLAACHGVVIGVGAIGRQVALHLAALGLPQLTLFDDDHVNVENLAVQGYWPADLHQPKVTATAALCRQIQPALHITARTERFRRSTAWEPGSTGPLVVFACVDSMAARRLIWETLHERAALYLDGRMSAEVIRVLAWAPPAPASAYASTLFPPAEAYTAACTAQATLYSASMAAGLMLAQLTRWLRGVPVDPDVTLNLLAMELTVSAVPASMPSTAASLM
jgi:sulfur carrier protein ThiS adenylyltransferase